MKYDALLGDSQWGDSSVMNELSMEMTMRKTLPVGRQAFLFLVEAEIPHQQNPSQRHCMAGLFMQDARSGGDSFLRKMNPTANGQSASRS
jgi:hypothetical protein